MTRIEEIRARLASVPSGYAWLHEDVAWLLSEVERLTRERDEAHATIDDMAAAAGLTAWSSHKDLVSATRDLWLDVFSDTTRLRQKWRRCVPKMRRVLEEEKRRRMVSVAVERERCARVCEGYAGPLDATGERMSANMMRACAAAIRRGGE